MKKRFKIGLLIAIFIIVAIALIGCNWINSKKSNVSSRDSSQYALSSNNYTRDNSDSNFEYTHYIDYRNCESPKNYGENNDVNTRNYKYYN